MEFNKQYIYILVGVICVTFLILYINKKNIYSFFGYNKVLGDNIINAEHFSEFNNFKRPTIICFSAPWCGACQSFKPIWEEFSNNNTTGLIDIKFIDNLGIDAEFFNYDGENIKLAEKYKIEYFPTIRIFHHNNFKEYNGELNKDELGKFVKEFTNTIPNTIPNNENKETNNVINN